MFCSLVTLARANISSFLLFSQRKSKFLSWIAWQPSAGNAIVKMWRILEEVDNRIDANQWQFATNTPKDVPQQQNNYDCGVFLSFSARSLVLQSAVPSSSVPAFRCHMILELQLGQYLHARLQAITVLLLPQKPQTVEFGRNALWSSLKYTCKLTINKINIWPN